jgi:hypothetical protein
MRNPSENISADSINRIIQRLQNSGYGWISKEECRKIILLVERELAAGRVEPPPCRQPHGTARRPPRCKA